MSEKKKMKRPEFKMSFGGLKSIVKIFRNNGMILVVGLVLICILGIEGVMAIGIQTKSKRFVSAQTVDQKPIDTSVKGVSMYSTGRDFTVSDALLGKLSSFHDMEANTVRIPVNFLDHISKEAPYEIDGAWLGQMSSALEMVFQSNYRVIMGVSIPEGLSGDPAFYEALWDQINTAFKHRPRAELWYELTIPSGVSDISSWITTYKAFASKVNQETARNFLITFTSVPSEPQLSEIFSAMLNYNGSFAVNYSNAMSAEELNTLKVKSAEYGVSVVLIEPENEPGITLKSMAEVFGFGYLVKAD